MSNAIPETLIQTSPAPQPAYHVKMVMENFPGWEYKHFDDQEIIRFFLDNPLDEFPDIIQKFNSFSSGPHKADIFRYYYLYINGGVYLDSDALLEVDIGSITNKRTFVSIKGYYKDKNLLFNGFLVCTPRHPIIHEALRDAYSTDDASLRKDYFLFCKNLHTIVEQHMDESVKIYQEKRDNEFLAGVQTFSDDELILTHYCWIKLIPSHVRSGPLSKRIYYYIFRRMALFKLHRFLQRVESKLGIPKSRNKNMVVL